MTTESRKQLVRTAAISALRTRTEMGVELGSSFCIYDRLEELGIEVRFMDVASMEGVYSPYPSPTILLSSLRPSGRIAYTCAHELGHHFLGTGTARLIEIESHPSFQSMTGPELEADMFAAFLLMPKATVQSAFNKRGWRCDSPTPVQLYEVSCWLGVSYRALFIHMYRTLDLMDSRTADSLEKTTVKELKKSLLGDYTSGEVIVVNSNWLGRPVDMRVGDVAIAPSDCESEGECVTMNKSDGRTLFLATSPGIGKLYTNETEWSSFIRVSRAKYSGRAKFRHLGE
ncbi:MAG: ImmA/IrrE family metallo-endopeptidase [Chloroflexi bacterium]|nr:ImmA/IrrE family metallo-endopeptidase [Chloroflexota bacterium]